MPNRSKQQRGVELRREKGRGGLFDGKKVGGEERKGCTNGQLAVRSSVPETGAGAASACVVAASGDPPKCGSELERIRGGGRQNLRGPHQWTVAQAQLDAVAHVAGDRDRGDQQQRPLCAGCSAGGAQVLRRRGCRRVQRPCFDRGLRSRWHFQRRTSSSACHRFLHLDQPAQVGCQRLSDPKAASRLLAGTRCIRSSTARRQQGSAN